MLNYESSKDETDKFCSVHNYKIFYQNFFITPHRKILEIGTSSCGFAKFLRDNNIGEHLVGADLRKNIVSGHIPSNETWCDLFDEFHEGDVSKPDFKYWIELNYKNAFDLIIEDCSHKVAQQEYLISNIAPISLSETGVWITEDINGMDNAQKVVNAVTDDLKPYAYLVDLKRGKDRYDDYVVVIDKRKL